MESRAQRNEEDVTAIITTIIEVRDDVRLLKDDVRWLKHAVQALLDHQGVRLPDQE